MKSFGTFAVCAFMYILIIILLQVCHSEGYTVIEPGLSKKAVNSFDANQKLGPGSQKDTVSANNNNGTNAFDFLQISDPVTKNSLNAVYGAMQGNNDCLKKTLCISGNYMQSIPGRDFIFMLIGRYVPTDWVLLYDIFRVSAMYGQSCEAYLCTPHE